MTQRYSGLVVGGPLDGQMLEATHNTLRAVKDPRPSCTLVDTGSPTYEFVTYLYQDSIWFPSDTTFGWAMNQLMEAYVEKVERDRLWRQVNAAADDELAKLATRINK